MALKQWAGSVEAIAQISFATVFNVIAQLTDTTFTLTINNKSISFTATTETKSDIYAALTTAWNASNIPEFKEVTAVNQTTYIELTSDKKGKPFIVTGSTDGATSNEVQTITIANTPTGGTFTIAFTDSTGTQTTSGIAYNANAATVETAFEGLSNVGAGNGTCSGGALPGTAITITFTGSLAGTNVEQIVLDGSSLTGGDADATSAVDPEGSAATNEVQTVTLIDGFSGGTFTISFDGFTSSAIAYNANDAAMQAGLETLPNIEPGDVTVSGTGPPWTVTFGGLLANIDVNLMTIDCTLCTGGAFSVAVTTTTGGVNSARAKHNLYVFLGYPGEDEEWKLVGNSSVSAGTFTLTFEAQVTSAIAFDADVETILTALRALSTIVDDEITSGGANQKLEKSGVQYYRWPGSSSGIPQASVTIQTGGLTGGTYSVVDTLDGFGGPPDVGTGTFLMHFSSNSGLADFASAPVSMTATATTIQAAIILAGANETPAWTTQTVKVTSLGAVDNLGVSMCDVEWLDGRDHDMWTTYIKDSGFISGIIGRSKTRIGGISGVNEIQAITVTGTPLEGSVKFEFEGEQGTLAFDSTAAQAEAVADAMGSIGSGNSDWTGGAHPGTALAIEFTGDLRTRNVDQMTVDYNGILAKIVETTSGDPGTNEVAVITMNGSPFGGTITYTLGGQTTSSMTYDESATDMQTAFQALSSVGSGNVTIAGNDGGPWTLTFVSGKAATNMGAITTTPTLHNATATPETTVEGGTDPAMIITTPTISSGPNHWDVADNWVDGSLPVASDDIVFSRGNSDCLYGINQNVLTFTSVRFYPTWTGKLGLPDFNTDNRSTPYPEYRGVYAQFGATDLEIAGGGGRIRINLGSVQSTVNISNTGRSVEANVPTVRLLGTHASNVVNIDKGDVGIAWAEGEVSTVLTLRASYQTSQAGDVDIYCSDGLTITTLIQTGGTVRLASNTTLITMDGGDLILEGSSAHAALNCSDGIVRYRSTGTMTAGTIRGEILFNEVNLARTVTNITLQANAGLDDRFETVVFTNAIILQGADIEDLRYLRLGVGINILPS